MTEAAGRPGYRCGHVAIVGRPNVGKSTLMNALIGAKIAITSRKAQTTRHRIAGVRTRDDAQFIYLDTPGYQTRHANALNRNLNRTVSGAMDGADALLFVVEEAVFGARDGGGLEVLPRPL